MSFKKALVLSFIISFVAVTLPYFSGWITNIPHVNQAKLPSWAQFFLLWAISCPLIISIDRIGSYWTNLYEAHYHNRYNAHDSYGEHLQEGDIVEVKAVTLSGISTGTSKIVMDKGYLKCKCHHGLMPLSFYHQPSSSIKIKKLKK